MKTSEKLYEKKENENGISNLYKEECKGINFVLLVFSENPHNILLTVDPASRFIDFSLRYTRANTMFFVLRDYSSIFTLGTG